MYSKTALKLKNDKPLQTLLESNQPLNDKIRYGIKLLHHYANWNERNAPQELEYRRKWFDILFFSDLDKSTISSYLYLDKWSVANLPKTVRKQLFNTINENGYTVLKGLLQSTLSVAAIIEHGYWLIAIGADATTTNNDGNNWLHCLCDSADNKMIERYLNNAIDNDVQCGFRLLSKKYRKTLLMARNQKNETPLQTLLNSKLMIGVYFKYGIYLIKQGADPSVKDHKGNTLLHQLLLTNNNTTIINGLTCGWGNFRNIEELPKHTRNVLLAIRNKENMTPLQLLLDSPLEVKKKVHLCIKLITLGAHPNDKNKNGDTALRLLSQTTMDKKNKTYLSKQLLKLGTLENPIERIERIESRYDIITGSLYAFHTKKFHRDSVSTDDTSVSKNVNINNSAPVQQNTKDDEDSEYTKAYSC